MACGMEVLVPVPVVVVNADDIGAGVWSAGSHCYLGCDARDGSVSIIFDKTRTHCYMDAGALECGCGPSGYCCCKCG